MTFESNELGPLVHVAARLIRKRFEQQATEYGLSSAQWRLLIHVIKQGAVPQARLSELLEIEPISVSRLVDRMEAAGWVAREADPTDRRVKNIVATPRTLAVSGDLRDLVSRVYIDALAGIAPAEQAILLNGLATISENLTQALGDSALKDPK